MLERHLKGPVAREPKDKQYQVADKIYRIWDVGVVQSGMRGIGDKKLLSALNAMLSVGGALLIFFLLPSVIFSQHRLKATRRGS